jgi:hypothetical protein
MTEILEEPDSFAKDLKAKKIYLKGANVSSQKEWGSGVLWAGAARPQHPTPRFIERIRANHKNVPGGGSNFLKETKSIRNVQSVFTEKP